MILLIVIPFLALVFLLVCAFAAYPWLVVGILIIMLVMFINSESNRRQKEAAARAQRMARVAARRHPHKAYSYDLDVLGLRSTGDGRQSEVVLRNKFFKYHSKTSK